MNQIELELDPQGALIEGQLRADGLTPETVPLFQKLIYTHYETCGRGFTFRNIDNPYWVVVSEIMLQQTQTGRIQQKFGEFITSFPDWEHLANAPLQDVLKAWQGIGYNRRAIYLRSIAQEIVTNHGGVLPDDPDILITFKGIGPATAASITVFAFNKPVVFVETNIRTVFIHYFFEGQQKVTDTEILPLVETALDRTQPRTWYYALTDFGVMLKKRHRNPGRKSAHYQRQSPFEGSDRQIRSRILKIILQAEIMAEKALIQRVVHELQTDANRVRRLLRQLRDEEFLDEREGCYLIR